MKIIKRRTLCTEISGLTPGMMKHGNSDIEELQLGDESSSLLSTGFTSSYIKDSIKEQVIKRSTKFTCVAKSLCDLIDNGIITPVMFSNNDTYALLVDQFNVYNYEKRIMGFYDTEKNSIFLLLNNMSLGASGSIADSSILSLLLHELMHYSYQNVRKDYLEIFDKHIQKFYKTFFDIYFKLKIPEKLVKEYVTTLYDMESDGKVEEMIDATNVILDYAQENGKDEITYPNCKAICQMFGYLSSGVDNNTGAKLGQLSRNHFHDPMLEAYNIVFKDVSPELYKKYESRKETMMLRSVFYQEFIASSEVSAMI